MTEKNRMNAEERKQAIIEAAKPLFAKKGFNGVSVRDIAKAAGVSEALLYRHFPSKDAMYKDILEYSVRLLSNILKNLKKQEVGTETLIHLFYMSFQTILFEMPGKGDEQKMHNRLVFYSLLEDVTFARMIFKKIFNSFQDLLEACYKVGVKNGDIIKINSSLNNRFWFTHHLIMSLNLCLLSDEPAFSFDGSKNEMIEEAILFALRGFGVTDKAINNYLKSEKKMNFNKYYRVS